MPMDAFGPFWLRALLAVVLLALASTVLGGLRRPAGIRATVLLMSHVVMCAAMAGLLLVAAPATSMVVAGGCFAALAVGFGVDAVRSYVWSGGGGAAAREAICCAVMAASVVLARSGAAMGAMALTPAQCLAVGIGALACAGALAGSVRTAVRTAVRPANPAPCPATVSPTGPTAHLRGAKRGEQFSLVSHAGRSGVSGLAVSPALHGALVQVVLAGVNVAMLSVLLIDRLSGA